MRSMDSGGRVGIVERVSALMMVFCVRVRVLLLMMVSCVRVGVLLLMIVLYMSNTVTENL